jgi:hypothetical protein
MSFPRFWDDFLTKEAPIAAMQRFFFRRAAM